MQGCFTGVLDEKERKQGISENRYGSLKKHHQPQKIYILYVKKNTPDVNDVRLHNESLSVKFLFTRFWRHVMSLHFDCCLSRESGIAECLTGDAKLGC